MEKMQINVISVVERDGMLVARARAVAADVEIHIRIKLDLQESASQAEIWQMARDEVLRYLDVA